MQVEWTVAKIFVIEQLSDKIRKRSRTDENGRNGLFIHQQPDKDLRTEANIEWTPATSWWNYLDNSISVLSYSF